MAASLNKTRRRDTGFIITVVFFIVIFSKEFIGDGNILHEGFDMAGSILIALCAVGRVYCTAFLGGFKNSKVIDYGPFSISRNPLYLCSFIGIVGICIISNHIVVMATAPLAFLWIYLSLIKREEIYLENKFGKKYLEYKSRVPRFFPKFGLYHAPKTVEMSPKNLLNALKDSVMWFMVFPLMEIIEHVNNAGYIKPLFYLP